MCQGKHHIPSYKCLLIPHLQKPQVIDGCVVSDIGKFSTLFSKGFDFSCNKSGSHILDKVPLLILGITHLISVSPPRDTPTPTNIRSFKSLVVKNKNVIFMIFELTSYKIGVDSRVQICTHLFVISLKRQKYKRFQTRHQVRQYNYIRTLLEKCISLSRYGMIVQIHIIVNKLD